MYICLIIDNPNEELEIYDILDIQESSISNFDDDDDEDYIPTELLLSAKWKVTSTKGLSIVRLDSPTHPKLNTRVDHHKTLILRSTNWETFQNN